MAVGPRRPDAVRHLEDDGVATVAERGHQDAVARARTVERPGQQQPCVGAAAATDPCGERIRDLLGLEPQNTVPVEEKHAETLLKLLDVLDDNDDVQQVAANFEIADEVMARLMA